MLAGAVTVEYLVLQRDTYRVHEFLPDEGLQVRIILQEKVIDRRAHCGHYAESVGDPGDTHIRDRFCAAGCDRRSREVAAGLAQRKIHRWHDAARQNIQNAHGWSAARDDLG